jgi:hypothetical protein
MKVASFVLAGLTVLSCIVFTGLVPPFDFLGALLIGWMLFIANVVPKMTVDWGGVATALVCLTCLAFGVHHVCGWLYGHFLRNKYPAPADTPHWRRSWTFVLLAGVVLMFLAGVSAVGLVHQSVWLATSPEPMWRMYGRGAATRTQSFNNLRQIGMGLSSYDDAFKKLPAGAIFDSQGRALHGWQTFLLPYIEEGNLFKKIDLKLPWHARVNREAFERQVSGYINPEIGEKPGPDGLAPSHYAGNVHVFARDVPLRFGTADFPDGESNTLMAGEVPANFKPWGHPTSWRDPALGINKSVEGFGNPGPYKMAQFLMADCTVRAIKEDISPAVLKALAMPAGRGKIPEDWDAP